MPELFVRPTVFKVGCPTYRCRNLSAYEVGIERGPSNLNQSFCEECLVQIIKKSPADIIAKALGERTGDNAKVAELEAKIAELETLLEESTKPVEPIQNNSPAPDEVKPDPKPVEGCKFCEFQYAKNTEEPCKSCKESIANGKGFINFKAREKKQGG